MKQIYLIGGTIIQRPPYYENPSGYVGILSGIYTLKPYRRKGIAKRLLGLIVDEAKAYGCGLVQITATDMGEYLDKDNEPTIEQVEK